MPNNPVDRINKAVDIFNGKISAIGTEKLNAAESALNAKMVEKRVITAKEYYDYVALKRHNPKLAAKLKEYIMEDPRIRADYDPNKFTK